MATKSFEYSQTFNVGDVVQSPYSTCSRKVLSRVFIDEIAQYRFITQELRDGYSKLWTKDKIVVKKGDVFTDVNGRIYIVESDDLKAWNIDAGTWAKLQIVGDVVKWDGRTLTEKTTVIGDKFSKYLG
jgi:hypothetical protein